ncbi:MAG: ABC transporter substrate-binding protein [Firmicutes bacterium]|nr:ABC transporter substrate-binding protein [Bacillota bacterium]
MRKSILLSLILVLAFTTVAFGYNEAPMLAELVKQGKLPPVEERLPKEPLVVEVLEEIGRYGGTWRRAAIGPTDVQFVARLAYEGLVRWNADGSDVVPNIAKSWDISEDGRIFTFYLREGMKWSDGHPFTADDWEFYWNDVILNEELTPAIPEWLTINGQLPEFRKLDDYTIQWEFPSPYALFIRQLAFRSEEMVAWYPGHYLKQFHPNYVGVEKANALAKEAGLELWFQNFNAKRDSRFNPECPVIWAWRITVPSPATTIVAERNPYYWKVDPEGNQLPYIDRVTHDIVDNIEVLNLKAAAGEIDMQLRHILWDNLPVFADNMERNNYRILMWQAAEPSNFAIYFNPFIEDEALRSLFRDVRFRRAMSLAIDREEMNDLAYLGLGRARQGGVITSSPFHVEGSELYYTERDLAEANRLLDEIGLTQRDSEGYRLRPDGRRLTINFTITPAFGPWTKAAELLVDYWKDIGVRVVISVIERTLFQERAMALDFEMSAWTNDRGLTPDVEPLLLLPGRGQSVDSPWFNWFYTNGVRGEEPPAGPERRAYDIYAQVKNSSDVDEIAELMRELILLNMENLWYIGTVGDLPHVVIVSNKMRNVPEVAVSDWLQKTPGNTWIEQYFFAE